MTGASTNDNEFGQVQMVWHENYLLSRLVLSKRQL